jgi:hypothetical protein
MNMTKENSSARAEAAHEYDSRTGRGDGQNVVEVLSRRLALLQDLLYLRLHGEVQQKIGQDSMLMPVSELKAQLAAKTETALFQAAESRAEAIELGVVAAEDDWFAPWLCRLLLDEADAEELERLAAYTRQPDRQRQLSFTDVLAKVLPQSNQAPLVLFNLYPLSVRIAAALAFGDRPRAEKLRRQQFDVQPALADCTVCRGQLLNTGKQCPQCGNPVWKHKWLVAD